VVDSLVALPLLRRLGVHQFVDLGSGGGFPGIPLAAALPADRALLIESIGKKARFLETALAATGLTDSVTVAAERGEAVARVPAHRERWPAVVVRAVAPLDDLVEVALPLLRHGGVLIAWKRGDPADRAGLGAEIAAARRVLAVAVGDEAARDAIETEAALGDRPAGAASPGRSQDRVPEGALEAALGDHRLVVVRRGSRPLPASWPRDPAGRRRRTV